MLTQAILYCPKPNNILLMLKQNKIWKAEIMNQGCFCFRLNVARLDIVKLVTSNIIM